MIVFFPYSNYNISQPANILETLFEFQKNWRGRRKIVIDLQINIYQLHFPNLRSS